MKQQKKPTRSAVQGVVKRAYFLYAALVLLLCLFHRQPLPPMTR